MTKFNNRPTRQKVGASANSVTPRLVSVKDACTLLGLGKTTVYQLINDHDLVRVRIRGRSLITLRSINRLSETTNVGA
jgi:excisionase family DNA binding protein